MSKARLILEIIALLQGTPVDDFARQNLLAEGNRVTVRCAETVQLATPEGRRCKQAMATALLHFSYRFTAAQLGVLADLYVAALERLEPEAVPRVRQQMCDPSSPEAQRDPAAAIAVCERLSRDS